LRIPVGRSVNSNRMNSGRRLLATLAGIVSIAVTAAHPATALSGDTASTVTRTEVTFSNSNTGQVIGRGYYQISRSRSSQTIIGENRYLDGERDEEVDCLNLSESGDLTLETYNHKFLNADGSPQSIDMLDVKTGIAACTSYSGDEQRVREVKLVVPQDTYAGSAQLALLSRRLKQGEREIAMHSFICFPGPRIVAIKATPVAQTSWTARPGKLLNLTISLDLGWLTRLTDRFIPTASGLFDPDDDFSYVGGTFDRFYRRRHVTMLCSRRPDFSVPLER